MSEKLLGINVDRVTTTQEHELGMRVRDVIGGDGAGSLSITPFVDASAVVKYFFPDGEYMYIKAGSAISAGNACKVDVTASATEPYTLIPTAAVAEVIVALAPTAIASGSYGWVQTKGRHRVAVNTGSIAAGAKLVSSGTAGALAALSQADTNFSSNNINALVAMAASIGILALDSNDSNAAALEVLITH